MNEQAKEETFAAKLEDLPRWFREELWEREASGEVFEGAHEGLRWVTNGVIAVAVQGPTWALGGPVGRLLESEDIRSPLVRLTPLAPKRESSCHVNLEKLAESHPEQCEWAIPMGLHEIRIAFGLYALVVDAFGYDCEWWGSGPEDVVVAKKMGRVVAIVASLRLEDQEARVRAQAAGDVMGAKKKGAT